MLSASSLSALLGPVVAMFLSLAAALGLGAGSSVGNPPTGAEEPVGDPAEPADTARPEGYWPQQISRDDLLAEWPRSWDTHRQIDRNTIRIYFRNVSCGGYRVEVHEDDTQIRIDLYHGVIPPAGKPVGADPHDDPDTIRRTLELQNCEPVLVGRSIDAETAQPVGGRAVVQRP